MDAIQIAISETKLHFWQGILNDYYNAINKIQIYQWIFFIFFCLLLFVLGFFIATVRNTGFYYFFKNSIIMRERNIHIRQKLEWKKKELILNRRASKAINITHIESAKKVQEEIFSK
jgi:hypothetical protein